MVPMNREQEPHSFSNHSSPTQDTEVPLVVDEIEVDDDMDEDDDEGFNEDIHSFRTRGAARTLYHQPRSESDTFNSTQTLYGADIEYITIHGRRYCENYNMPNDDAEQSRLLMLNDVYLNMFDGRLTMAPLQDPREILDIGSGTGEWAIGMAELYPSAHVLGIDIAKIQSTSVPDNVAFQIDDAEYEGGWTWPKDTFDLVHFQNMVGAFKDWNHIYGEAFRTIKPGGYIEVMEPNIAPFLNYFLDKPRCRQWSECVYQAAKKAGRPMDIDHLETKVLAAAGFIDISVVTKTIPCGAWPSESQQRKTGRHFFHVLLDGIEALSLRLLVEQLKWQPEAVIALCDDASRSVRAVVSDPQRSKGISMDVTVVVGRKPCGSELELPDDESTTGDSMRTVRNGDLPRGA